MIWNKPTKMYEVILFQDMFIKIRKNCLVRTEFVKMLKCLRKNDLKNGIRFE